MPCVFSEPLQSDESGIWILFVCFQEFTKSDFFSLKCICPIHERNWGEEELAGIFWTTIYCRTGFQLSASAPCRSMVSILLLKSESSNVANTYFSLSKHFTYSWVCRQLLGYIFSPILLKQHLHFFWNHFSLVWEQKVDTRADKWQHLA